MSLCAVQTMWHQCQQLPRRFLLGPGTAQSPEGRAAAPGTSCGREQGSSIIDTLGTDHVPGHPRQAVSFSQRGSSASALLGRSRHLAPVSLSLGRKYFLSGWLKGRTGRVRVVVYRLSMVYQVWYWYLVTSWFSKMIYSKDLYIKVGKLQRAELLGKCPATSHGPVREESGRIFCVGGCFLYIHPQELALRSSCIFSELMNDVLNWLSSISLPLVFLVLDAG